MRTCLHTWLLPVLLWTALTTAAATEPVQIASQLLHAATLTDDPQTARRAAIAFYRAYPEESRAPFGMVAKALERDDWRSILPTTRRHVRQLGQPFVYDARGGPLAPLARTLLNDLAPPTLDRQRRLATILAELYPHSRVFAFIADGIERIDRENEHYATSYLRGQMLLVQLRKEHQHLADGGMPESVTDTTPELTRRRLRQEAINAVNTRIEEAEAMVTRGEAFRPLDVGIRDLTQVGHQVIDELEAIGEL